MGGENIPLKTVDEKIKNSQHQGIVFFTPIFHKLFLHYLKKENNHQLSEKKSIIQKFN